MANAKKKRRRQQGLISWIGSILAIAIGLSGVAGTIKAGGLNGLANRASFGLLASGGKFNLNEGLIVYGPMIGAIVFKKLFSTLAKSAKVSALVPRIG